MAGGGPPWYEHDNERDFYQAIYVVILVSLTLVFEFVTHHVSHAVEHSYSYGASKDTHQVDEDRKVPHKQLYKELAERVEGEFMALGFLACLIFFGSTYGFFDALAAGLLPSERGAAGSGQIIRGVFGLAMPYDRGHWLHLAEEVHIKLFFGMLIYQILIYSIVSAGVAQVKLWSELTNRKMLGGDPQYDTQLKYFLQLHALFLVHFEGWRFTDQQKWRELEDLTWGTEHRPDGGHALQDTMDLLDNQLSISHYLSYCIEDGVVDLIEVHHFVWLTVMVLFVGFAFLHAAGVTMFAISGCIIAVCLCVLLVVRHIVRKEDDNIEEKSNTAHEIYTSEPKKEITKTEIIDMVGECTPAKPVVVGQLMHIFVRFVETMLYIWCYSFSSVLFDKQGWSAPNLMTNTVQALVYAICTGAAASYLPDVVIHLLTQSSVPPYLSEEHVERLRRVMREPDPAICDMLRNGQIDAEDMLTHTFQLGSESANPTRMRMKREVARKRRTEIGSPAFDAADEPSRKISTCSDWLSQSLSGDAFQPPAAIATIASDASDISAAGLVAGLASSLSACLASAEGQTLVARFVDEVAQVQARAAAPLAAREGAASDDEWRI